MSSVSTDRRQGLNSSAAIKVPCAAATLGNIVLTGLQTIDGVVLASGDRVLVKSQTNAAENGIYVADTGNWTRDLDFDGAYDVVKGTIITLVGGNTLSGTLWRVDTTNPSVGSAMTFVQSSLSPADSNSVQFIQAGAGAIVRTAQAKMRDIVSVLDFGTAADFADNTKRAANAVAFTAALTAGVGIVYVPAGTYYVTGLVWPNVKTQLLGDGPNNTVIDTTAAYGIYIGHYGNTYGSFSSRIDELSVVSAAATVGVRINNTGIGMSNVVASGGDYGFEVNSQIGLTWDHVVGNGTLAGIYYRDDHTDVTYNPVINGNPVVQQGTYLNCQGTGNAYPGPAGSSGVKVNGVPGFMTFNTFIGQTNQSVDIGWDLLAGITNCTFICCWCEQTPSHSVWERAANCQNIWINFKSGTGSPAAPDLSANSLFLWGNQIYPISQGGGSLGYLQSSGGNFIPIGFDGYMRKSIAKQTGLYGMDATTYNSDTYIARVVEQYASGTSSGAGVANLFQVTAQYTDQTGIVEINATTDVGGNVIQAKRAWYVLAGVVTFVASYGADINTSGGAINFTDLGSGGDAFKITLTGIGATKRWSAKITSQVGPSSAAGVGGQVVTYIGP